MPVKKTDEIYEKLYRKNLYEYKGLFLKNRKLKSKTKRKLNRKPKTTKFPIWFAFYKTTMILTFIVSVVVPFIQEVVDLFPRAEQAERKSFAFAKSEPLRRPRRGIDRKSTRLNSSHT